MKVELLAGDEDQRQRFLKGCEKYKLKVVKTKKHGQYVTIEVSTPEDVISVYWLGANLSHPFTETALTRSSY